MGISKTYKGQSSGLHKAHFNGSMADSGSAAGKTAGGGSQPPVGPGNKPTGKLQGAMCKKGGC